MIAYIMTKEGHAEKVKDALLRLVEETRREKGCVNYDLHQSLKNPNEFVMLENWSTPSDLDAHAKTAHIQEFARESPVIP